MTIKKEKPFIFRAWFINRLRSIFHKYPPYYNTLNKDKEIVYIKSKKGKDLKRVFHICVSCGNKFKQKLIRVDHTDPIVDPNIGFPIKDNKDDWTTYIERMFNLNYPDPMDNLKKMCKSCHDLKTKREKIIRTVVRKKKSKK